MSDLRNEVICDCSNRKFILDKPRQKHMRATNRVSEFFEGRRTEGIDDILEKIKVGGHNIEKYEDIPKGFLTLDEIDRIRVAFLKRSNPLDVSNEILYSTIKEAPWESDFKKITMMDIENELEIDETIELIGPALEIIMGTLRGLDRKNQENSSDKSNDCVEEKK